jgi:5'-nucleotidase
MGVAREGIPSGDLMNHTALRRIAAGAALSALALAGATGVAQAKPGADSPPGGHPAGGPIDVQLLALNDFHGNLEAPSGSSGRVQVGVNADGTAQNVNAGGAEYLATQLQQLASAQAADNTITVAAGDLIGASPLLSAAFHDEPTIEALGLAGLDYASVGNHEFDEGPAELLRIQNGGCHPVDGCADGTPFAGADFQYLSANAFVTETGQPLLAPYAIHEVEGEKIGFIGMTLEGTPNIVSAQGTAGLGFADEIQTANRYAAELQAKGVEAIVVLLHEGGNQTGENAWDINGCNGLAGPIVDIATGMSDAIDVVVSGHTHQAYNCEIDKKLVTSASSFGRLVTDIDLRINQATGDVIQAKANNVIVNRDVAKDPAQTELISRYRTALGPIATKVVGSTTAPLTRDRERLFQSGTATNGAPIYALGESPLGNVIADAQLAATQGENAVAALMNPGGVRADLNAAVPFDGAVTYEEAFTVQPFANNLVTLDLTGAQLQCLLEQQFQGINSPLYPSSTLTYDVDRKGTSAAAGTGPCTGTRVPDSSVEIGGTPVVPTSTYRITVNNFLAGGGDGFTVLKSGTNAVTGAIDLDAFIAYLGAESPLSAPTDDRITAIN